MSNDNLMLLFTAGIFFVTLLTFIVILIAKSKRSQATCLDFKISKK